MLLCMDGAFIARCEFCPGRCPGASAQGRTQRPHRGPAPRPSRGATARRSHAVPTTRRAERTGGASAQRPRPARHAGRPQCCDELSSEQGPPPAWVSGCQGVRMSALGPRLAAVSAPSPRSSASASPADSRSSTKGSSRPSSSAASRSDACPRRSGPSHSHGALVTPVYPVCVRRCAGKCLLPSEPHARLRCPRTAPPGFPQKSEHPSPSPSRVPRAPGCCRGSPGAGGPAETRSAGGLPQHPRCGQGALASVG